MNSLSFILNYWICSIFYHGCYCSSLYYFFYANTHKRLQNIKKDQNIYVRTSHNTVVSVALADLWVRVLAFSLDLAVIFLAYSFLSIAAMAVPNISTIFLIFAATTYHLLFEIFNKGQSLGKKVTKIRVVAIDGGVPTLKSLIIRWAFRIIDILATLGSLASFTILSSTYSQRLGDIIAGTVVVKTANSGVPTLEALQKLNTNKERITYPQMKVYNDDEMVLLKKGLERFQSQPTAENRAVLYQIYDGILVDTGIPPTRSSKVEFLTEALTSYILVSR